MRAFSPGVKYCERCCEGANAVLTVGLCTDEAGSGAVKEGEEAGHSKADVGVGRPQVQSCEPGKLNLQNVLGGHLDVGHLHGDADVRMCAPFLSPAVDFDISHSYSCLKCSGL